MSRLRPDEHFISEAVWDGRPYVRYEPDWREPVREEYGSSYMTGLAGQVGGYMMMRHPPPGLGLGRVYAEIRPDEPVWTGPGYWHYHPTIRPDKDFVPMIPERTNSRGELLPAKPLSRRHVHTFEAMQASGHIDRDKGNPHDHRGTNNEAVHFHRPRGKYVFPPGDGRARRLDVHPLGVPLFADAEVVFLALEGCPKSDSILTAILASGIKAAVFGVPSVTLWQAPELLPFAASYLRDKVVVVVPDNDLDNPLVVTQALCCRTYLTWRSGARGVCVAAPTSGKGADDHLHAGGSLGELEVFGREFPDPFAVWKYMERLTPGREDRVRRNFIFNVAAAVHAGADGTIKKAIPSLAGILGVKRSRAYRATADLVSAGGWSSDRPLATVRGSWRGNYYDRSEQWDGDTPTLTIRPELRATTIQPTPLSDYLQDNFGLDTFE